MDLLALASTRLDLLRTGSLAAALPQHRLRLAPYLRERTAFGLPDLEWLGLAQVVSWLIPAKRTLAGRGAEAMTWADEIFAASRPDMLLLGDATEAALPFAITAQKLGMAVVCLEAGMPTGGPLEQERLIIERLATFRFSPHPGAAAGLQEAGLECHYQGDLLAGCPALLPDQVLRQTLAVHGLKAGRYAVLAFDGEGIGVPAESGLPCVRLAGSEGQAHGQLPPVLQADSLSEWLALLAGGGCLVSDQVGLCRLAAGAGLARVLVGDPAGLPPWYGEIATLVPPGQELSRVLVPAGEQAAQPAPAGAAETIARMLTRGA